MSAIKVGDLVMVVRNMGCNCDLKDLGRIFTVIGFHNNNQCPTCKKVFTWPVAILEHTHYFGRALCELKKIDPPSKSLKREVEKELETQP